MNWGPCHYNFLDWVYWIQLSSQNWELGSREKGSVGTREWQKDYPIGDVCDTSTWPKGEHGNWLFAILKTKNSIKHVDVDVLHLLSHNNNLLI